jgi:hypothetical protein
MLRDIEVFMPTLLPVVLESKTEPLPASAPALADLDLAAFSGLAREELTMAERCLGEHARAMLPADQAVVSARLAVLTAPYEALRAGMLAYVQTTATDQVAYLANGTQVDPQSGSVLLRRSVIALAPRAPAPGQRMAASATGNKTGDDILKFANMAAAKLPPGPAGTAVSVALGLVNLFTSGGPSEAEIIIDAIQKAITAAVAELETFIVDEKMKDIKIVVIDDAYAWLKGAAAQTRRATTVPVQIEYARLALVQMEAHIGALRPWLNRLTKISVPSNVRSDLRARTHAAKLVAHGIAALFTLHKLRLQFDAFLAMNETTVEGRNRHKIQTGFDLVAFKLDVLGDDRDIPDDNVGEPVDGSMVLAYRDMFNALVRDRTACIQITPPFTYGPFRTWGKFVDPYAGIDQDLNGQDWINFQESVGLAPQMFGYDNLRELENLKNRFVSAIVSKHIRTENLEIYSNALSRYLNLTRDWDREVGKWNALTLQPAPMPAS